MSKRKFADITPSLFESEDEDERRRSIRSEYESERVAILMGFEESTGELESQLRSTNHQKRKHLLEQKVEYQETLRTDRLKSLENRIAAFETGVAEASEQRQKSNRVDSKMQEIWKIVEQGFDTTDWQSIRKARYIRYTLEPMFSIMTAKQKEMYESLLKELTKQGFRVAKYIAPVD
jgi:hypothetical protein